MTTQSNPQLPVVDFHCDALWKLLEHEELDFVTDENGLLDVTPDRLIASDTVLQTFAIFVPDRLADKESIWKSVDLFYGKILRNPHLTLIRTASDLKAAVAGGRIGALLSLEGVDSLQGDLTMLRLLYHLGLRALGLTWNHANWAADGVMEPRQGGLTAKGRKLVEECERLGIILDVSHLSEKGFWELTELAERSFIASHSNARSLCAHPRNLTDDQIRALIAIDGRIGVTYVPYFVKDGGGAAIDDVIRHMDYIASLGGARHLMLGSDFDGIDQYVDHLRSPGDVSKLIDAMLRAFPESMVRDVTSRNAIRFLEDRLPHG
ncbi:dipeptidase [Paenibacillus xylaniclasticus]|uniref:dipeptidase n=1 Tax=Paenibacillus xylaniclasticus TaxID=588083 RepID=UPI000FD90A40|nr:MULTISPECIES: dipeptidase [Paenibacillus]GFN31817.1 diguanylate cyclase [Paenibacillus curdlanolyticus]